ncbi:lipoprotein [Candidatus Gracilibacteria bacterium]|nr:lipoprotein [Candidatus Gracilibacteria bacterium]
MKKVLILTVLVVGLTGCQSKPAVENDIGFQEFSPETVQERLDEETLVEAVLTMNKPLCGTIENAVQRDNCLVKIADAQLVEKARIAADKKPCGGIQEVVTKKQCELIVEDILADRELIEDSEKEIETMQSLVDEKDLKGCAKLNDTNFREQCEINIYNRMALESKDESHCEKIDPKDLREDCKAQF